MIHIESATSVERVHAALAAALDGGPTLLPVAEGEVGASVRAVSRAELPTDGLALLVPTSGSTGAPKLVELGAAALVASAAGTHEALGGTGQWLLALPVTHIAGLQVLTRSVLAGTDPVRLDDGPFTPGSFATATARLTGPRRYTALVPTQLRRLLADPSGVEALGVYDGVLIGGAAASVALLADGREHGIRLITTYGMSETAGGCVYDGTPISDASFELDDGRILLRGPMLARGYRGEPELTSEFFLAGAFRTSDAGQADPDGRLTVLGRLDDVVISGGVNVHPAAVEAVLAAAPGVRDVVVAGVADAEWGQVVTAWIVGDVDDAQVRDAVRARLGVASVPRTIHRIDAVPMLASGKPDRRRLAAGH